MSPTPRHFSFLRDWYDGRDADRYAQEAVRNTLGNEEKNFQQQMNKIQLFQINFRNKLIAANPKIAREHFLMQRSRRIPSRAYSQFMKEANARSKTAVRKQFKNVLPQLDKYQVRRAKFINSMRDKYAATNPRYARTLANQRARDKARKQAALKRMQQWEKWAKQNNPNVYKQYLRNKKKYGGDPSINSVSRSFYNRPQDIGLRESQNRWRQAHGQKPIRLQTLDNIRNDKIQTNKKLQAIPKSEQERKALRDAQDKFNKSRDAQLAQFRNQLVAPKTLIAPKQPKVTPHVTRPSPKQPKITKPVPKGDPFGTVLKQEGFKGKTGPDRMVDTFGNNVIPSWVGKPKKMLPVKPKPKWAFASPNWKKSGGKVTKTYANGGGVRKPKYNKKG